MAHNLDLHTLRREWMLKYLPASFREQSLDDIRAAYYKARLAGGDIVYPIGGGQ